MDNLDLSSPRTLEACLEVGILEDELRPRSCIMSPGETAEMVKRKEEWCEQRRQQKIDMVKKRRDEIVARQKQEKSWNTTRLDVLSLGSAVAKQSIIKKSPVNDSLFSPIMQAVRKEEAANNAVSTSTSLEYEAKRIEAAKRRQEREIQHMVEGEQKMSQMQAKLQQHEKEAQIRVQEHLARLHKSRVKMKEKLCERLNRNKQTADAGYESALELAEKERERDRLRMIEEQKQSEAHTEFIKQRDAERLYKLSERETRSREALEQIEKKAQESQIEMQRREQRLQEQMERKSEFKRQQLAEKQAKAKARIARALEHHRECCRRNRELFDQRQKDAEFRAKQKQEEALVQTEKQREKRDANEKDRHNRLVVAVQARKQQRDDIIADRKRREFYHEVYTKRYEVNQLQKLEHALDIQARLENVERIRRVDEYKRLKLLCKLRADKERTLNLRQAKEQLVEQRKHISRQAFLRKHKIREAVENMRITNKYTSLDSLVDLSDLPKVQTAGSGSVVDKGGHFPSNGEGGCEITRAESTSILY